MSKQVDISVIVTCHAEGILIHKTLLSIERSKQLLPNNVRSEIILHADNPTLTTQDYLKNINKHFKDVTVYVNSFGGPGESRDFCIKQSNGRYIALIDGDDLMSANWLPGAYSELESRPYGSTIAHSEMTVEFGGFNSVVQKYPSINQATDSLLNVWSARWNAIIFAPANVLKKLGYPHNKPGYGYEDWLISCRFIEEGLENILIPQSVMFVRRKESDSVWDQMRADWLILPRTKMLSFENIRGIQPSVEFTPKDELIVGNDNSINNRQILLHKVKKRLKHSRVGPYAKKIHSRLVRTIEEITPNNPLLPNWLIEEWHNIHSIERQIFPTDSLVNSSNVYHSITELHYRIGGAYHRAVSHTRHDSYDYILFVPWLVSGGADSFAINYANATAKYNKNKKVLVVATMPGGAESVWRNKLSDDIDFIPLNDIFTSYSLEPEHQNRLIEQLIENSHATHLHILNSIAGYDFIRKHKKYLDSTNIKVIVTSFSESTDETKRVFGFSHTHVPYVYDQCDFVTTDNSVVRDMWVNLYGFSADKILLHRPMIDLENITRSQNVNKSYSPNQKRVLWAARIAPEKLPELVPEIGKLLPKVHIDMYGTVDPDYHAGFVSLLPPNVTYKGGFNGFFSIDTSQYQAYLYTSLFDGLPNTLIEASVAHLPIVASNVGGIKDFINQDTGVLIDDVYAPTNYARALESILNDNRLAEKLAANAYRQLSNGYEPTSHYKSISKMLKDLGY